MISNKSTVTLGIAAALFASACGHSAEELEVRDQRIAKLETENEEQSKSLASCKDERVALNRMLEGMSADSAKSAENLARLQQALAQANARERQQQARLEQFKGMLGQLKSMIDSGKLRVRIVRNRMVVELPEAVLFDSGKADLKADGKVVLEQLAPVLSGLEKREFQVAGHTDNAPIKTAKFPSNWELSTARAVNVSRLLQGAGVAPERISAAGYADTQPVAANDSDDGKKQNRRIEIVLLPNLDELPDLSSLEGGSAQ
jgi:chemotaxis protein MotB